MTRRVPRDTSASCPDCGWVGRPTTQRLAARALSLHTCARYRERVAMAARVEARKADPGTRVDCTHPGSPHQHGTRAAYQGDKCRCRACRDACSAYDRQTRKLITYGRWSPMVDADPVRAHVREVMAAGIGIKTIAVRSGVSTGVIAKLVYGVQGKPPSRRVRRATAEKLSAVTSDTRNVAPGQNVDAVGAARRLRALIADGWSQRKIAARAGIPLMTLNPIVTGRSTRITRATHDAVTLTYEALWDEPPPATTTADKQTISRSKGLARRNQWAPAMAWDDETIDDPAARPHGDATALGVKAEARTVELDTVYELARLGHTTRQVADRLGVTVDAITTAIRRKHRGDILRRLTVNNEDHRSTGAA